MSGDLGAMSMKLEGDLDEKDAAAEALCSLGIGIGTAEEAGAGVMATTGVG